MKKIIDGIVTDMTAEEITAMRDAAAQAEAEEKHRPLSFPEVQEMMVRQQINTLDVDDQTAVRMTGFYPEWKDLIGKTVDKSGYKFQHNGKLYKTIPATHTFQSDWIPGVGTESLYTRIDEEHTGEQYDPIPAERSMEYTYGLYYADPEDSKVYLCTRTGEADGGTVTLHYLPHELVGLYFEEVSA